MLASLTAASAAASATGATSGILEQKRLLAELEKKVEEQKKLIEMQKVKRAHSRMRTQTTTWTLAMNLVLLHAHTSKHRNAQIKFLMSVISSLSDRFEPPSQTHPTFVDGR